MINLNVQRSKQIKFGIEISGVQLNDIKGAVRLMHEGIEYGFPIKIFDGKILVEIPPLENVIISELRDRERIGAKLEVIAGDIYLTPWEDDIVIEKPIKVEATIQEEEVVIEKIKPDIKAMVLSELELKPQKKDIKADNANITTVSTAEKNPEPFDIVLKKAKKDADSKIKEVERKDKRKKMSKFASALQGGDGINGFIR